MKQMHHCLVGGKLKGMGMRKRRYSWLRRAAVVLSLVAAGNTACSGGAVRPPVSAQSAATPHPAGTKDSLDDEARALEAEIEAQRLESKKDDAPAAIDAADLPPLPTNLKASKGALFATELPTRWATKIAAFVDVGTCFGDREGHLLCVDESGTSRSALVGNLRRLDLIESARADPRITYARGQDPKLEYTLFAFHRVGTGARPTFRTDTAVLQCGHASSVQMRRRQESAKDIIEALPIRVPALPTRIESVLAAESTNLLVVQRVTTFTKDTRTELFVGRPPRLIRRRIIRDLEEGRRCACSDKVLTGGYRLRSDRDEHTLAHGKQQWPLKPVDASEWSSLQLRHPSLTDQSPWDPCKVLSAYPASEKRNGHVGAEESAQQAPHKPAGTEPRVDRNRILDPFAGRD